MPVWYIYSVATILNKTSYTGVGEKRWHDDGLGRFGKVSFHTQYPCIRTLPKTSPSHLFPHTNRYIQNSAWVSQPNTYWSRLLIRWSFCFNVEIVGLFSDDTTRVLLKQSSGDYINANHVNVSTKLVPFNRQKCKVMASRDQDLYGTFKCLRIEFLIFTIMLRLLIYFGKLFILYITGGIIKNVTCIIENVFWNIPH